MRLGPAFALVALLGTVVAVAPERAAAAPAKRTPIQFLGREPHGPLARVDRGAVKTPEESACRTWGDAHGVWSAVDAFGSVVGTARVTGGERYDVTNCDELALERASGREGVGVFVRGSYAPMAIRPFSMSAAAKRSLSRIVRARDARIVAPQSKKKDLPLGKRMLAFQVDGQPPRAVVGGRGLSVYRFERGGWVREYQETPCDQHPKDMNACKFAVWDVGIYLPISVLDMNADGVPEIVVHEAWCDAYDDVTLVQTKKRRWDRVEAGIHGAFA